MTSLFASRRKPKRVGRDIEIASPHEEEEDSGPVVRRPGLAGGPRNKSKLRVSFDPSQSRGATDEDCSEDGRTTPLKAPKRLNLLEQSAGNNLLKRSLGPSRPLSEQSGPRAGQDDDRPAYSKNYLNELRNSTPSTPRDLPSYTSESDGSSGAVDLFSKFGNVADTNKSIPSHTEIQEKKQRRARLAKEQDFIALDDGDDGRYMQLSTHKIAKETRLVREDEDIGEGFDDYVEDPGRVALGKKARVAQLKTQREEMRDMIADAEHVSDEDGSDAEHNLAYESAQTRKAMDGKDLVEEQQRDVSTRGPTIITPIPRLGSVLNLLRSKISSLEYTRAKYSKEIADLQQEKAGIAVREIEIQRLLREAGERYEQLQRDSKHISTAEGAKPETERGLETMGIT